MATAAVDAARVVQGQRESGAPPRQVLVVSWRRHSYRWSALVIYCVEIEGSPEPAVVQRWVPSEKLRPVRADPNQAFGVH